MRIWFTGDDLARTRLAMGPSPLIETVLSARPACCRRHATLAAGPWRPARSRGLVDDLLARTGRYPDFVFEQPHGGPIAQSLEALAAVPRERLASGVADVAPRQPGAALRRLAAGERDMVDDLMADLCRQHDATVGPGWERLWRRSQLDLAQRAQVVAAGGVERLLATLNPEMTWASPVLHSTSGCTTDIHLGGRGVLLVPSVFAWPHVIVVYDVAQPMIVYPVRDVFSPLTPSSHDPVAALLGGTRAGVLRAVAGGSGTTTSGIAGRVGISVALASHHLRVLRDAGLLSAARVGRTVRHALTPLAVELCDGADYDIGRRSE